MPTVLPTTGWAAVATIDGHPIVGLTCACPWCSSQLMRLVGVDEHGVFLCFECRREGWWEHDGEIRLTEM